MKKTLTLFLALVVSLLTLQASAAMYIVGNAPFGDWKTNAGVEMTASGNNYTATVEINNEVYFVFATQLCSTADDWTTFANYRMGPTTNDYVVTTGNTYTAYSGQGDNSFKFTGNGTYTFTFNRSNNQFTISAAGPVAAGDLYILGEVNGNSWSPATGVEMDYNESRDLYTATVTTAGENEGYSYFSFTTQLGSDADDWAGISGYRYGAEGSDDYLVTENTQMPLQRGETAFKIPAGRWNFTVSLTGGYLLVEKVGDTPVPTGTLYILGEANGNTWSPNTGVALTQNESTGLYSAQVTFNGEHSEEDANVSYFSFTTKLAENSEDWDGIAAYRLTPVADEGTNFWVTSSMLGQTIQLNPMGENIDVAFRIPAGTYTITVNLGDRTCVITRDGGSDPVAGKGWPAMYGGVMLQGFYWDSYKATKWTNLTDQAQELGQYFDVVWVPNSGSVDDYGTAESMGYMPVYWLKHNTCFGTENQLRDMISTFHNHNTSVLMDMVINHKSGKSGWIDLANETVTGPVTGEPYSISWTLADICRTDECVGAGYAATGAADEGEDFDGSRDLDHTSANVQNNIKTYQKYLMDELGYDGFRYDMCKGYAGYYVGLYNQASQPAFSVGEYWDGNAETLRWWLESTKQDDRIQTAVSVAERVLQW